MTRPPSQSIPRLAALAALAALLACDPSSQTSQSSPSRARCSAVADQCELASGPLGVCERAACAPGETPPCFQCTPQH
jgi:hypothetical protein